LVGIACTCNDDDDDDSSSATPDDDDDDSSDDDLSDDDLGDDDDLIDMHIGDDDTVDDDTTDDDTTDDDSTDDDTVDDDTVDDDSTDDDTTDDDTTDDDTTDDDTADDDTTDDDTTDDDTTDDDTTDDDTGDDDLLVEKIEGYANSWHDQLSVEMAADGELVVISEYYNDMSINRGYVGQPHQEELLPDVGENPHLAVGADNRAYISYVGDPIRTLKLMSETASGWNIETIDGSDTFYYNDVAVYNNVVHVAYNDASANQLVLATKSGGSWSFDVVDQALVYGLSICVDANGYVLLTYHKRYDKGGKYTYELCVASKRSGSWYIHELGYPTDDGYILEMDLDPQNFLHIAHYSENTIHYTTNRGGAWTTEDVFTEPLNEEVQDVSIAADSQGSPHVAFQSNRSSSEMIYYADKSLGYWHAFSPITWNYMEWPRIVLDDEDNIYITTVKWFDLYLISYIDGQIENRKINVMRRAEYGVSLQVDSLGRPHVAYLLSDDFDVDPYMLYYGYRNGDEWTLNHIASAGECFGRAVLSLDAQDHAHIVHLDIDGHLKYTTDKSGSWTTEAVDDSCECYYLFWQTLDRFGRVHILYRDDNAGTIKAAHQDASGWNVESFAAGYPTYPDTMAFGADDRLHVVFFSTNSDLVYAVRDDTGWDIQTPPPVLGYIDGMNVVVDNSGDPHIMYYNRWNSLRHMTNASGDWSSEYIMDMGDSEGISTTIDDNNRIYSAMFHYSNFYYITNRTGAWTTVRVDSEYHGQRYNSIRVFGNTVHAISDQAAVYYYRFPVWFPGNE